MSRYIDADKLQKDGWKLHREKHGLATSTFETMELDCAPTADVVKVVRCKDCIFYYDGRTQCLIHDSTGYRPDDYCNYGERANK